MLKLSVPILYLFKAFLELICINVLFFNILQYNILLKFVKEIVESREKNTFFVNNNNKKNL